MNKLEQANPLRRQFFMVRRSEVNSPTASVLKELDLILAINGQTVSRVEQFELISGDAVLGSYQVTLVRDKVEMVLDVPLSQLNDTCDRVVIWAGAILQAPFRAVLQQSKNTPSGIYVSGISTGSPAYAHGVQKTLWITQVNGSPTPDLDAFVEAVKGIPDQTYVRVKTLSFDFVVNF